MENAGKTYFVTYCTVERRVLETNERDIALETIVSRHRIDYWVHCAVVMPDHVHFVATLYAKTLLQVAMQRIKSVSSHLMRRGPIWQDESFDRILRGDEDLVRKCDYVVTNPVRAGLADSIDDYRWTGRSWVNGDRDG